MIEAERAVIHTTDLTSRLFKAKGWLLPSVTNGPDLMLFVAHPLEPGTTSMWNGMNASFPLVEALLRDTADDELAKLKDGWVGWWVTKDQVTVGIDLSATAAKGPSHFPHRCNRCSSPAYVSPFSSVVDCSSCGKHSVYAK